VPARPGIRPTAAAGVAVLAIGLLASLLAIPQRARTAEPAGSSATACVVAGPPNSLWSLARCCAQNLSSDPFCRYHSKNDHFIILRDNSPDKPNAYLIIPTTRVTGIEDRQIFAPPVADLWAHGWRQAQIYLKKPAADTGLAINSGFGRSQDQLHIHISCVHRDVARALADNDEKIGGDPAKPVELPLGPQNHIYRVIKVKSLTAESPFDLAAAMSGAKAVMAEQGIAVVGSKTPGVYYVLNTRHEGANRGAAEELLEQACRS
jgi:CDP-diacylglycerol pyrophosphatase